MNNTIGELIRSRTINSVVLDKDQTVLEAARVFTREKVGAAAVLDHGKLVGIFSERDILNRIVTAGLDPKAAKVGQVMTKNVVFARPEETTEVALAKMDALHIRHLPVIAAGNCLGVLSVRDLMQARLKLQAKEIEHLSETVRMGAPGEGVMYLVWKCLKCGHHETGQNPPDTCPGCRAPKQEFALVEED